MLQFQLEATNSVLTEHREVSSRIFQMFVEREMRSLHQPDPYPLPLPSHSHSPHTPLTLTLTLTLTPTLTPTLTATLTR